MPAENRELLTECQVLERQIRPKPSGGQEKGEEPQERRDHGSKCHLRMAGKSMESTKTVLITLRPLRPLRPGGELCPVWLRLVRVGNGPDGNTEGPVHPPP